MFAHYPTRHTELRAGLVSAGVPGDVAERVSQPAMPWHEYHSVAHQWGWGLIKALGSIFVVGAHAWAFNVLGNFWLIGALTISLVFFAHLAFVRFSTVYRYARFVQVALNQSTVGVGFLCQSAVRQGDGKTGEDYVKAVVSHHGGTMRLEDAAPGFAAIIALPLTK